MKSLKTYSIPFTGLKLGKHEFDYVISNAFFDEFEYSLVKKADLKCHVEMEKQETMLILNFHIIGTLGMTCDKCLAEYPQPVDISEQQIAKFSDEGVDEDEEIITLTKNDHEIDLAGLIYEYVNVAAPLIAVCSDEGNTPYCDKEMIDRLNALAAGSGQDTKDDPRWDALKNIK
ncbi:MAG: YceD family protein [Sphingobacteriales bacterium]